MAPATARRRVQLTDQALVAVRLGREIAGSHRPNVAHLVAGLAAEEHGIAGRVLRADPGWVRLGSHPAVDAPGLAPLDDVLRELVGGSRPRWTVDVLAAAVHRGGEELADALDAVGMAPPDPELLEVPPRRPPDPDAPEEDDEPGETYGRWSLHPRFTDAADLLVARARARGGASDALAREAGVGGARWEALRTLPPVPLEDVVALAQRLRGPDAADTTDLLDAVALSAAQSAVRLQDD